MAAAAPKGSGSANPKSVVDILLNRKLLTGSQIQPAIDEARKGEKPIQQIIVDSKLLDKTVVLKALSEEWRIKAVNLTDTPRGPLKFDHLGNVVGTFYIRRLGTDGAKYGLKLWNKTIKTYHNVSQFWTYDEKKFLAQPVYARDYPPLKP